MTTLYEYLDSYGLMKSGEISKILGQFSEDRLAQFITSYIDVAANHPLALRAQPGATDIFPDSMSDPMAMRLIQQLSIYANKIYVHDRLVKLAQFWNELDSPQHRVKFPTRIARLDFYRSILGAEIEEMLKLKPLVDAGIVFITPANIQVPRKDPRGLYVDSFYGAAGSMVEQMGEEIPEIPLDFREYCETHLTVYPAKFISGDPQIVDEQLTPRNMIAIQFKDDPFRKFYQLYETTLLNKSERKILQYFDLTGKRPVDPKTFENWVKGSKREVLEERMRYLHNDLTIASSAQAKFITNLPVSRDLSVLNLDQNPNSKQSNVIAALLKLNLPFFEEASTFDIIKARKNEVAFEEFRLAIDKAFAGINALPDSTNFQKEVEEIYREMLIVPLLKVKHQMEILQRNLFISGILVLGSLVGTILTKGDTLVTATSLFAMTEALKMYKEGKAEEAKAKQLPSFFYWQATHRQ
jgi:hypothetical protein